MHSWQNGTRCRDGVNVLWCRFHLVWLVFEGSIPTCAGFHSENFFVTCSCCFFFCLWFFKSSKREERQARERCMVCRVCTIELCCSQRTKNHHKFKCFQVKFFFPLRSLEAQAKPHKTQVQSM